MTAAPLALLGARTATGEQVDVAIADGRITQVSAAGTLSPAPGTATRDLTGYVLLPAPAEPHAHVDKALLADRVPNRTGDLAGAIEAIEAIYPSMTDDDILDRARRAVAIAIAHGYTQIRSHADCGETHGLRSVQALAQVRKELGGLVDLQIVALMRASTTGPDGANQLAMLRDALACGADLVGGAPHLEPDPMRAIAQFFDVAGELGRDVDLHTDEETVASTAGLAEMARIVLSTGFPHLVSAGHCVSLGVQDEATARRTAEQVAAAGIVVIANPQTNLYLQARDDVTCKPRGLTAVQVLLDAGATVAAGSDNWRDPFNPMSRIDALETASLMVSAGHLLPDAAYRSVSDAVRVAMGYEPVQVAPGSPAHLLAVQAGSLVEAIAAGPAQRIVLRAGAVVAETTVRTTLHPALTPVTA